MSGHDLTSGMSRRAVLGGLGAGAAMLGAGLPAGLASAASGGRIQGLGTAAQPEIATALKPTLRYVVMCGHDFAPLQSPSSYTTVDGQFHFNAPSSDYASVLPNLPVGAVIKELELYGTRGPTGSVSLELWKSTVATGAVVRTAVATVPVADGVFTTTVACDDIQDMEFKSTPFVFIDGTAAPSTYIFGLRVGYVSPTGFVPLPPTTQPRVYDSRKGDPKLAPNEERIITLPVPAAIGAAVFTLTITETTGIGGFVAAFPAGIPWPGNSSINWAAPNQNTANTVVCAVSSDSKIVLRGGANATHVVVDVAGWIA